MVVGVGIDLVDVARFRESLARTPSMVARMAESGRPGLEIRDAARALAEERGVSAWQLSLTHTATAAGAIVVAVGR